MCDYSIVSDAESTIKQPLNYGYWKFSLCTYLNGVRKHKCEICDSKRDELLNMALAISTQEWACGSCTLVNQQSAVVCELCGAVNALSEPSVVDDTVLQLQPAHYSDWKCSLCTYLNGVHKHKCEMCDSKRDELLNMALAMSTQEWACGSCTLVNQHSAVVCELCGAVNAQSEPSVVDDTVLELQLAHFSGTSTNVLNGTRDTPEGAECLYSGDNNVSLKEDRPQGYILEEEARIVLIGHTGAGKSETGNSIVGEKVFKSTASPSSVTRKCQMGMSVRFGRSLLVVDTPGLFDTEIPSEEVMTEIVRCIGMTAPGPHVFIVVLQTCRYTEEEQKTIEQFINMFGKKALDHVVVVFTKKDDLTYNEDNIEDFLSRDSGKLRRFLDSCHNRYVAFNNRGDMAEKDEDVKALLRMIDDVVAANGGFYTNDMFAEAERMMKEREEKIRHEQEEAERAKIQQIEANYKDIIDQQANRIEELELQPDGKGMDVEIGKIRTDMRAIKRRHKEEIQRIRAIGVDRSKYHPRHSARKDINDGSDFFTDYFLPGAFEVIKIVLPFLLRLI